MYERIKYLRKNFLQLSQEEFALKLKISRGNLSNIEINRVNITDRVISDICREFNVNEDWLRNGGPDSKILIEFTEDDEVAMYVQDLLDDEDDVIANDIKNFIKLYYGKMDENSKQVLRNIHYDLFSMINKNEEQT